MSDVDQGGLAPIVVEHVVRCSPDHAFRVWTERFSAWWPPEKSFAGAERVVDVVLERRVGGSIYEVRDDGSTQAWGAVTAWDAPRSLAFTWHLRFPAEEATDVEVAFHEHGEGETMVRVTHGGWDRLADERSTDTAQERRRMNRGGWSVVLPLHAAHAEDTAGAALS